MLRVWIIAKKFGKCKDFIGSTNYRDAKVTIGRTKRGDWSHQLEAVATGIQAAHRHLSIFSLPFLHEEKEVGSKGKALGR